MAEVIMMKHPQTGVIKKGFIGFSWTVFFFGWLAMVFRGDVILGICIFLAEIASLVAVDLQYIIWQLLLLSLVQILFAFTYNNSYTSRLIKKGFRFSDSDGRNQLGAAALGMPLEACVLVPQANTTGTSQPATTTESLTKASDAAEGNLPKVALPSDDGKGIRNLIIISLLVVAVIVVLIKRDDPQSSLDVDKGDPVSTTSKDEKIKALENLSGVSDISPFGELHEIFKFNSQYTDVQRENRLADLKGKVVSWDCTVYEVSKIGDRRYTVTPKPKNGQVGFILNVVARNEAESRYIENLMTGSPFTFIGMLNGEMFMRSLILDPVILAQPLGQQAAERQGGDGTGLVRAGAKKDAPAVVPQPGEYSIREEGVSGKITLARPDDTGRYPVSIATWNNDERGSTCDFEGFCSIKGGMLICPSEGMEGEDSDENHMAIKILKHGLEVVHEAPYLCGLGASMKGLYLPD